MRAKHLLLIGALTLAVALIGLGFSKSRSLQKSYTAADVERALEDAEKFAREGKYQQALERHIWYHENALKYDQAQFGVRLSFALSDWAELGKVYPPAKVALR